MLVEEIIQVTLAQLSIQNYTTVTLQDYFLIALDSIVNIDKLTIDSVQITKNMFTMIQTTLNVSNTVISNLTASPGLIVFSMSSCDFSTSNLTYSDSNAQLIQTTFSELNLDGITTTNIVDIPNLILTRQCMISKLNNFDISGVKVTEDHVINLVSSNITEMSDNTFSNMDKTAIKFMNNNIQTIQNMTIDSCPTGLKFEKSTVSSIQNSSFKNLGSTNVTTGGAIYSKSSKISILNSTFTSNFAIQGAAVKVL